MTTGRRNPNPRTAALMPPPPLTLILILALVLPALSDDLPSSPSPSPTPSSSGLPSSPSPSPAPSPSGLPPENASLDPTGIRLPPPIPASVLPACPPAHPNCDHSHHTPPLRHGWRLNFGQLMGIVLAGVAAALQVVLGAFLVYKRVQLTEAERPGRGSVATTPRSSF